MFDITQCVGIYAADIETTGLLNQLVAQGKEAKLHNFCATSLTTGNSWIFHGGTEDGRKTIAEFLDRHIILVMHNGIGYDKKALELFGFDTSKVMFIDSLALSWYLDRERKRHGLEAYGDEFGVPKPEIKDWKDLTQEDYDHRVKEDVKIQTLTYKKLKNRFEEIYGRMSDLDFCNHKCTRYLMFKMRQLSDQADVTIKVDRKAAEELYESLCKETDEKFEVLVQIMPKVPVKAKRKPPAKAFKKNRELSATGEAWKALTEERGLPFEYEGEIEVITGHKEPNPASPQQVKDWLFSLGWVPLTFEFKKDEDGQTRSIPQIYVKNSGGEVCPSIVELSEDVPDVLHLVGLGVLKHRKGLVKGFLDRMDADGTDHVVALASGFTNTLRLKHKAPCVNLPSLRASKGKEIRGMLIAKEGKMFCGADLSALENILKFNFQYPHDPEYVKSQMSSDFDPHLEIAFIGGLLTRDEINFWKIFKEGFPAENYPMTPELDRLLNLPEEKKKELKSRIERERGKGKSTNYACQYGAGGKTVARTAKIEIDLGMMLVKSYKKLNWSIEAISKEQEKIKTSFGDFQLNPLNGLYYNLKFAKDSFSTLIQGCGSYILDLWLLNIYRHLDEGTFGVTHKDVKLLATFHDELILEFDKELKDKVRELVSISLEDVNTAMLGSGRITIPFGCDIQFGERYSEIH